MTENDLQVT